MNEKENKGVEAMEKYGGSFVQELAQLFRRADSVNFEKLKHSFSDYWNKYGEKSKGESPATAAETEAEEDVLCPKCGQSSFSIRLHEEYTAIFTCTHCGVPCLKKFGVLVSIKFH